MISCGHARWSTVTFSRQARPHLPRTAKALPRPLEAGDEHPGPQQEAPAVPPPPVPGGS